MAVEARHGHNDSGRSAEGILSWDVACIKILTISKLLAANLEEADPAVYEILQRVRDPPNDDRLPQQVLDASSLMLGV